MSTTASEIQMAIAHFNAVSASQTQVWSKSLYDASRQAMISSMFVDEWVGNDPFNGQTHVDEFEMRKTGSKEYGFFLRNKHHHRAVARYKCSHLEARRRFALLLVTRRLRD